MGRKIYLTYDQIQNRILNIYLEAAKHGKSHDEILLREKEEIWDKKDYGRLPNGQKSQLFYYSIGCSHFLQQTCLEWRHKYDGKLIDKLDDVLGASFEQNRLESTHVYKHNGNPFTPWKKACE